MSTNTHQRRRRSQKAARAAFASYSESSIASSSTSEGRNNSIAKTTSTASGQQETNPSTSTVPTWLAVVPCATPQPSARSQSNNDPNYSRPEPTTFLDSAVATSSISSVPSSTPRFHAIPPPTHAGPLEASSTTSDNSHAPSQQSRLSSSSFNLWYRCHSVGFVQFGTQSSPPPPPPKK